MNLQQFTAARQADWVVLHDLVERSGGKPERLGTTAFAAAGRQYRAAAADLAYARRRFPGDPVTIHLEDLVRRSRSLVYSNLGERQGFVWFLTTGYWRRIRERPGLLLTSLLLLVVPTLGFGIWAHADPATATRVVPQVAQISAQPAPEADKQLSVDASTGFATMIFTNNIRVALIAFAGGMTLGLLTGYMLITNGVLVGLLGGAEIANGYGSVFFQLVVPHGVLELSLIAVAGAAGLRLGDALLRPGRQSRVENLVAEGRAAIEIALGSAFWLVPCGIVEGFVTPAGLGLPAAIVIGVGLGALYWGLLWWRGAPAPVEPIVDDDPLAPWRTPVAFTAAPAT